MKISWVRVPREHGYADYALWQDGVLHAWVRWVGHPTATYKYMIQGPGGEPRTYETVGAAKRAAEYIHEGGRDEDVIRITR